MAAIFGDREWRIYDIWLNTSDAARQKQQKSYLKESLNRLNENLSNMEELPKDIEQISRTLVQSKVSKPAVVSSTDSCSYLSIVEPTGTDDMSKPQSQQQLQLSPTIPAAAKTKVPAPGPKPEETAQWKIERIIVDNLPENFKYAKLEEITKNSILLENSLRLPILGRRCRIHPRSSGLTRAAKRFDSLQGQTRIAESEVQFLPAEEPPLISQPAGEDVPIERRHEEKTAVQPQEIPDTKPEKEEEQAVDSELEVCEKILRSIEENYGQPAASGEGSPSPVKKSKQEHQRLVAKLKHQIPDEWQRPFDKNVALAECKKTRVEEWGNVNRRQEQLWQRIGQFARDKSVDRAANRRVRPVPLSNHTLVESLAEKITEESKKQPEETGNYVMDDMIERLRDYQHLLTKDDLKKLQELGVNLDNPLNFGLFLAELKSRFNEKYKSPYLQSLGVALPYRSRRHDMGGVIEQDEWPGFFSKLEKLGERIRRKRRRIISQRKRRGKSLLPRKYIYRPPRRPDMSIFRKHHPAVREGPAVHVCPSEHCQFCQHNGRARRPGPARNRNA